MKYEKIQLGTDKKRGVFRVMGICFESTASDEKIEKVMKEVFAMENMAPGLMTAKALYQYIECLDDYVLERMSSMNIGSSFNYDGLKISRCSENTYNGKNVSI